MTGLSLYDRVDRGRRRRRLVAVAVVVVLAAAGAGAWWLLRPVPEDPHLAAEALARAWSDGDLADAPFTADAPDDLDERVAALLGDLAEQVPDVALTEVDDPAADDAPLNSTARFEVTWSLPGGRSWSYDTTVAMVRVEDELTWGLTWDPRVLHPDLADGLSLAVRRTTPPRGDLLATDGTALVTDREVVDVGIQPSRVEDLGALASALADELATTLDVQLDRDDLQARVEAADPDAFVPVLTLREDDYLRVQEVVQPLPGTVFRRRATPLAPTRGFARFTLGSAGPVTAEMIEQQPDRYEAGGRGGALGPAGRLRRPPVRHPGARGAPGGRGRPRRRRAVRRAGRTRPAGDGHPRRTRPTCRRRRRGRHRLRDRPCRRATLRRPRAGPGQLLGGHVRPRPYRPGASRVDLQDRDHGGAAHRDRPRTADPDRLPERGHGRGPDHQQRRVAAARHRAVPDGVRELLQHGLRAAVPGPRPHLAAAGGGAVRPRGGRGAWAWTPSVARCPRPATPSTSPPAPSGRAGSWPARWPWPA